LTASKADAAVSSYRWYRTERTSLSYLGALQEPQC